MSLFVANSPLSPVLRIGRHLSQTNPNLPKPLEEDHSFLDLASQKKGRCRSSRSRYKEHARNGTTEGPLSCCPALTSSFSSTSHTSGVTEDEEGTTTASTRRLSTAAAVNAAALAFVDELQHRHESCGLMYSNRSALSLGMASSSCRNGSRTGVSPQSAVAGGGGHVISAGRFAAAPAASSGDTGYYRGPGRAGTDGRNSFPAVVASSPGGAPGHRSQMGIEDAGPSVSAAAAAALLQDAHAAWKESGGSVALLPVVQKCKSDRLSLSARTWRTVLLHCLGVYCRHKSHCLDGTCLFGWILFLVLPSLALCALRFGGTLRKRKPGLGTVLAIRYSLGFVLFSLGGCFSLHQLKTRPPWLGLIH